MYIEFYYIPKINSMATRQKGLITYFLKKKTQYVFFVYT